jgi:hypothetical protein
LALRSPLDDIRSPWAHASYPSVGQAFSLATGAALSHSPTSAHPELVEGWRIKNGILELDGAS